LEGKEMKSWLDKHTKRLDGKTVAITGSTGGLGAELCDYLASLGADLVLVDRNLAKSKALAEKLQEKYPSLMVNFVSADMSDMTSVKAAGEELVSLGIDCLILNAGAYSIPRCITDIGYDNVFTINFISPYYLARRILPSVRARGGRVVAVGSIAHNYSETDPIDIDFRKRKKASLVYGNAKRYLTFALQNLSMGDVIIAHPGITFTGITNHYPKLIFALIKHPMKVIFMKPRKAALSILYGLFADVGSDSWIGPRLFDVWGLPRVKKLRTAGSEEKGKIIKAAENIYQKIK
jgi:NAD(P)-dependent dehydrogenase (short-subunit alcohol dehydrogenase family)